MSASGFMPLAILLKIVGMVVGLYFASGFFIQTVKVYTSVFGIGNGKMRQNVKAIEHAFEMIDHRGSSSRWCYRNFEVQ